MYHDSNILFQGDALFIIKKMAIYYEPVLLINDFKKINLINLGFYQIDGGNMIFIILPRAIDFLHLVLRDALLTIS